MSNYLNGYDLSYANGVIPQSVFNSFKLNNEFCMIRANFGSPDSNSNLNEDTQFFSNLQKARNADCLRGTYHFAYPEYNSAEIESNFYIKLLRDYHPIAGENLALDFEVLDKDSSGNILQSNVIWAYIFLKNLENAFGVKAWLYSNLNIINSLDWSIVSNDGFGLWLADWTGNPNELGKAKYWNLIGMSQFSDQAIVNGINGRVDNDAFYGTPEQFKLYGFPEPGTNKVSNPQATTITPITTPTTPTTPAATITPETNVTTTDKSSPILVNPPAPTETPATITPISTPTTSISDINLIKSSFKRNWLDRFLNSIIEFFIHIFLKK